MVSLNWSSAWEAWKLVLAGIGLLIAWLYLTLMLDSIILSSFIIGVTVITVVLYRKGAENDDN